MFLVPEAPSNCRASRGTSQITGNALLSPPFWFFHAACQGSPCYYGQPELKYRPIVYILTGESPEETRKSVVLKQIEYWPKFSVCKLRNKFRIRGYEHF